MLTDIEFKALKEKGSMPEWSAKLLYDETNKKTFIAIFSTLQESAEQRFMLNFSQNSEFYAKQEEFVEIFDFDELEPLPDQPMSEIEFWDIMADLVKFFYELKKEKFCIRQVKNELLFLKGRKLVFASFQNLEETNNESLFEEDVVQLGKIAFKLLFENLPNLTQKLIKNSEFSPPCKNLLEQLLCSNFNRISIEELIEHPVLKPYPDNSILDAEVFTKDNFDILEEIGHGSFGEVNLAVYKPSGEKIVLKASNNHKMQETEVDFLKQAIHPHIVRCYGRIRDNFSDYLILQYCQEGDLFIKLSEGKLDENLAFEWICELSSALYYLHTLNLMHRDIKPQNILLEENEALLTDFGVSKTVEETTGTIVGTTLYYSPEQYYRKDYGKQADVFSLGLVFFNMLVGSHPFSNEPKQTEKFFDHVRRHGNADAYCKYINNEELRLIIAQMMIFDPKKRLTAADLCIEPIILEYIKFHNLPAPNVSSILLSPRVISGGFGLFTIFDQLEKTEDFVIYKYNQNKQQLADLFSLACKLLQSYIFTFFEKIIQKNQYFNYVCNQIGYECLERLNQEYQKAEIFENSQIFFLEDHALQFGSVLQSIAQCKNSSINFCTAFLAKENIVITQKNVFLACQRFIIEEESECLIKLKNCNKIAIYLEKIRGKIKFQVEGTCQIDIYGESDMQGQIEGLFTFRKKETVCEYSESIDCLRELMNVCYPELFADGRGYFVKEREYW